MQRSAPSRFIAAMFAATTISIVIIAISPAALAKGRGGGKGGGKSNSSAAEPPPNPVITADETALGMAKTALAKDTADLKAKFEATDAFTGADKDLLNAEQAYDAERKRVLTALAEKPDYAAALDKQKQAEAHVDDVRDDGGTPDDIQNAAKDALAATTAVRNMENDALAGDAQAVAARRDLQTAQANFVKVQQQETQSIQADPKWIADKKVVDAAQAKLTADSAKM